MLTFII